MKKLHRIVSVFVLLCLLLITTTASAAPGDTTRVSLDSSGTQGNGDSSNPSISADGRYVAFNSSASNLVAGDTNGQRDVFVRDRNTNTTTRVSLDSSGTQGNSNSAVPSISADGRYVAFDSAASNLVGGDTNGAIDVFVRDRNTNTTTRVSLDSSGTQGNGGSSNPSISADGRYVAFYSAASNLVGGDTNGAMDVFVRDLNTSTTTRVSLDSSGTQGNGASWIPSISSDGRYVAFYSAASNLVGGDTNGAMDVFVRDLATNTTMRVSLDSSGTQGNSDSFNPSISSDGRYVAFTSYASNLVAGDTNGRWDIFVRDRQMNTITRVSLDSLGTQGNNHSYAPSISSDGRYVAFYSYASNLVGGDTNAHPDVFVRDRNTNTTTLVSLDSSGTQGNDDSYNTPSISADGRYVAFNSSASNLVAGDTNGQRDIFVHEQDVTAPFVASTNLIASYTGVGPSNFTVTFSENVNNAGGGAGAEDAANPNNYVLMEQGSVSGFQTAACNSIDAVRDTRVTPSGVTYTPNTAVVTLGSALPIGSYRLFVCGTTSIVDMAGNHLNNSADYTFDFTVAAASTPPTGGGSSGNGQDGSGARWMPKTGFAPNVVTLLPEQPRELAYTKMSDLWLEIPSQNVKANILGVPQVENAWDVKWLSNDAGWLNGTAFPSWVGNSVLTAHVTDANGKPGPFAKLKDMKYGDRIVVHLSGQQYTFEVRATKQARPDSTAYAFESLKDVPYLTLITCEGYDKGSKTYSFRRIVRAVLMEVK